MKILLFGAGGQVGTALQKTLTSLGSVTTVKRDQADFAKPELVKTFLSQHQADVIINAAAYTAVDKAESEPELASKINTESVRILAEAARAKNALLIHYSTDYVFDGQKSGPYTEDDPTNPLSVYGRTKRDGEKEILDVNPHAVILRTSWVYSDTGKNFLKTILRLAAEKEELKVVSDQIGVPTSAEFLAEKTGEILQQHTQTPLSGTELYHLVPQGKTHWAEFAVFILEYAKTLGWDFCLTAEAIKPIKTSAYPTPATRPLNSCLSTKKFERDFQVTLPAWQLHAKHVLDKLLKPEFKDQPHDQKAA